MNDAELMREQCAAFLERTPTFSSSKSAIYHISDEARREMAKAIRNLPVESDGTQVKIDNIQSESQWSVALQELEHANQ